MRSLLVFLLLWVPALAQESPETLAKRAVGLTHASIPKSTDGLSAACLFDGESIYYSETPGLPPKARLYPTPHLLLLVGKAPRADTIATLHAWAYTPSPPANDPNLTLFLPNASWQNRAAPLVVEPTPAGLRVHLWHPANRGFIGMVNSLPMVPSSAAPHLRVEAPKDPRSTFPDPPNLFLVVRENSPDGPLALLVLKGNLIPSQPLPCSRGDLSALQNLTGALAYFLSRGR